MKLQARIEAVAKQQRTKAAMQHLKDNPVRIVTANTAEPGEWRSAMDKLSDHFRSQK
jgi:hypothetical protein